MTKNDYCVFMLNFGENWIYYSCDDIGHNNWWGILCVFGRFGFVADNYHHA